MQPGPQREIYPGGTKIDAGPPNSSEPEKRRFSLKFGRMFGTKLGKDQKKRSSLKFGRIFGPESGEDQKKKVFTHIWPHFGPKFGRQDEAWEQKNFGPKLDATT